MNNVLEFFKKVWAWVRIIYMALIVFKRLVEWFKDPERRKLLIKKIIAVIIKEVLEKGDYAVINCLYNEETEEVESREAQGVEGKEIDSDTKNQFGNKEMIVLK
ncbi:hypothetical protein [Helicobacter bizzozeronii]|uniref:hypothetical protein n=1 Tax=Helicobacter bizzozeronii TaxID=56877 RepID=UPI000CEE5542|nr:hypothetical protein [Helicobacter bizzozeronii]